MKFKTIKLEVNDLRENPPPDDPNASSKPQT